jgi:transposase
MLLFSGIQTKGTQDRWSKKYIKALQEWDCESPSLKAAINLAIEQYLQLRNVLKQATLAIRTMAQQPLFAPVQKWLQSVCGVGLINGMVIQTEIQDIYRFKRLDRLCDYAGFVPDIHGTNDKERVIGITHRRNEFLREALIESSWMLIRKDPAMLMKYNEYRKRMNQNKAIIRIGKHLLSRIRYVWSKQKEYEKGVVQ